MLVNLVKFMKNIPLTTHQTGLLQWKGYRTLEAFLSPVLAKHRLSHSQWKLLGVVYDARDLQASHIAEILDVKAPLVTRMLAQLLEKKLIYIEARSKDRRAKWVSITASGAKKLTLVEKDVRTMLGKVFQGISPEHLDAYKEVLKKIVENGISLGKKPDTCGP